MLLPDPRRHTLRPSVYLAVSALTLASCGGGSNQDQTPQERNPAAGIYSGADTLGNPASLLITPDGYYVSVASPKDNPDQILTVSTANGSLTPIVFESSRLYAHDVLTGDNLLGSLLVNYTQSLSVRTDLIYWFGTRSISASFLGYSFSGDAPSALPSSGTASLYLPRSGGPHQVLTSSWTYSSSQLSFTADAGECELTGRVASDPSINVLAVSVTATAPCGLPQATLTGYLWRDATRAQAYAVLKPPSQAGATPLIVSIKL